MTTQPQARTSHPYFMYDAMKGQPQAIAEVLEREAEAVASLAEAAANAERLHVVGIGTSWHAALVGEHLLRMVAGREDARAWNSFEFRAYPPSLSSDDVVIVLSHRGTKSYSVQALEMAKAAGSTTAIVTAIGSKARAELADVVIRTCPEERSSAFTISHTTAMTALAMLAAQVGIKSGHPAAHEMQRDLKRLPAFVQDALAQEQDVRRWVQGAKESQRYYFAGWGPNASTAYEVALKIKETSYVATEGFQLEQYLHGPFVATDPGCTVTFIAPPGQPRGRAKTIIAAASAVGAHTSAITPRGDTELAKLVDTSISVPPTPENLTPIVYLAPLQLFTYWLAVELNCNPDVFRLDDPAHKAARQKYQL